jgi:hypothetical protein
MGAIPGISTQEFFSPAPVGPTPIQFGAISPFQTFISSAPSAFSNQAGFFVGLTGSRPLFTLERQPTTVAGLLQVLSEGTVPPGLLGITGLNVPSLANSPFNGTTGPGTGIPPVVTPLQANSPFVFGNAMMGGTPAARQANSFEMSPLGQLNPFGSQSFIQSITQNPVGSPGANAILQAQQQQQQLAALQAQQQQQQLAMLQAQMQRPTGMGAQPPLMMPGVQGAGGGPMLGFLAVPVSSPLPANNNGFISNNNFASPFQANNSFLSPFSMSGLF